MRRWFATAVLLGLDLASMASHGSVAEAQARAVSFDQALDLGGESPAVKGPRDALVSRATGDDGMGGTLATSTLTLMPGAVLNPDQDRGFDAQASFTQGWNLADLGGARRRSAEHERAELHAEVRAAALRARLEAAERWIALWTATAVTALLEEQRAIAEAEHVGAERAVAAGEGLSSGVAEARARIAELSQDLLDAEGERFAEANRLAVAMGASPHPAITPAGPLPAPSLPPLADARVALASVDAAPQVAMQRAAVAAARARQTEAAAHFAPQLSFGAQLERSAAESWVVYGIAGLSWMGFGQDRRAVSLTQAATQRHEAALEGARVLAGAEADAALHEVAHARRQLGALEETSLPALEALATSREAGVRHGEETLFALFDARRRLLDARIRHTRARAALAHAEVHLWLLLAERREDQTP